jgi:hypothetical protein
MEDLDSDRMEWAELYIYDDGDKPCSLTPHMIRTAEYQVRRSRENLLVWSKRNNRV